MEIKDKIKTIREAARLDQSEFAKSLNYSPSIISMIETGKRKPTKRFIDSVKKIYRVNEIWFETGKGNIFLEDEVFQASQELLKQILKKLQSVPPSKIIQCIGDINQTIDKYL